MEVEAEPGTRVTHAEKERAGPGVAPHDKRCVAVASWPWFIGRFIETGRPLRARPCREWQISSRQRPKKDVSRCTLTGKKSDLDSESDFSVIHIPMAADGISTKQPKTYVSDRGYTGSFSRYWSRCPKQADECSGRSERQIEIHI
jgi:hypothetical protein